MARLRARPRAIVALDAVHELDDTARDAFIDVLAHDFSPDPAAVLAAAQAYHADASPQHLQRLQDVTEPARQELFRRLNMAPGGTPALVALRTRRARRPGAQPAWRAVDADLLHLFALVVQPRLPELRRIEWHTSALVLEKLIAYEAVHAIAGWDDLRRRLQADRRCFGFFHPALPDEPLIFIEVALTRTMSASVQPLLDLARRSTTRCRRLRDVLLDHQLPGRPARHLVRQPPDQAGRAGSALASCRALRRFATLSPIPGFRDWLDAHRDKLQNGPRGAELRALFARIDNPLAPGDWARGESGAAAEALLMPLCAYYLVRARRGGGRGDAAGEPLDPVARFHLSNGAVLERLNWLGDTSAAGMQRSCGSWSTTSTASPRSSITTSST